MVKNPIVKKIVADPDCIYVSALNLKNLMRILTKAGYINAK